MEQQQKQHETGIGYYYVIEIDFLLDNLSEPNKLSAGY